MPAVIAVGGGLLTVFAIFAIWYWWSPKNTDVGYSPNQPVPFSHALHAGELGMDCRYCHNTVEQSFAAAVPPTQTCMNCHTQIKGADADASKEGVAAYAPSLRPVAKSWETNTPIDWKRVHLLPDYVYFPHSEHIAAGVGCSSCHGRVDRMEQVHQVESLSMGWCLDCHRNPEPNLRPLDQVTNMDWNLLHNDYDPAADPARTRQVNPPQSCSGCHY